jgi:hypothetical protein
MGTPDLVWAPNLNQIVLLNHYYVDQPLSSRPSPNRGVVNTRANGADAHYNSLHIEMPIATREATTIEPGDNRSLVMALGQSHHGCDFSVTIAGADQFLRRFAGRVETGKGGFSESASPRRRAPRHPTFSYRLVIASLDRDRSDSDTSLRLDLRE